MNNQEIYKHLAELELEPGASMEEIKASYKELAQVWHPDRFQSNVSLQQRAHSKLQRINESYQFLKLYCQRHGNKTPKDNSHAEQRSKNRESTPEINVSKQVVGILSQVTGMTKAHRRDFDGAPPKFKLCDGSVVKVWKNPVGVDHVFLADKNGNMVFGGFVGWIHADGLYQAIAYIEKNFT